MTLRAPVLGLVPPAPGDLEAALAILAAVGLAALMRWALPALRRAARGSDGEP